MTALHDFLKRRETEDVDYEDLNDDDVLEDALLAVTDATKKRLLMRYKRLKQEVMQRDGEFTNKVMRNYFTCIRKVGPVWIRSDGMFGSWSLRFVVLCNAGMIYFKVDTMRKEDDLKPKNFRPLNDFVLQEVPYEVSVIIK